MPMFGNSFLFKTYEGVFINVAVYRGIKFDKGGREPQEYDEAQVDLKTGNITFYMDTSPEAREHWKC